MNDRKGGVLVAMSVMICCLGGYIAVYHSDYLNNPEYLAALVLLQLLLAAVWNFRSRFFVMLILTFLISGVDIPGHGPLLSVRWFVLIGGACAGYIAYMKESEHRFTTFHLVGFFCVLAAVVSAVVSSYPTEALLKAASLLLLFLYGSSGVRLAVIGRERRFTLGLLLGSEILIYLTAVAYFLASFHFFGNQNSLGAVAGVVLVPVMLWGVLISETVMQRRRRVLALILGIMLLLSSYSRAGVSAAIVSCVMMCIGLRQYRILVKGTAIVIVAATFVATTMPPQADVPVSVVSAFLHKGKPEEGMFGSRTTPWLNTVAAVRQNPWFGTGFGTSTTTLANTNISLNYASLDQTTREHGSSYLAIVEWVGLLGVVPFSALLFMILLNIQRVLTWMRRTGNPFSPAVPLAAILAGGLVHAAFEDWLFAVGYYLTVLFWSLAFVLIDLLPPRSLANSRTAPSFRHWVGPSGTGESGR